MLWQINELRRLRGLPLLQLDPALDRLADEHVRDMLARGYFDHYSPTGEGPIERMLAAGEPYPILLENLSAYRAATSTRAVVTELMSALLASPKHRANLLDSRVTHLGLAFGQDKDDQLGLWDSSWEGAPGAGTVIVCQQFSRKSLAEWSPEQLELEVDLRERVTLMGTPLGAYDTLSVQVIDRATGQLVRFRQQPLLAQEFRAELSFDTPGDYEVRLAGSLAGALLQESEPLALYRVQVSDRLAAQPEASESLDWAISYGAF